MGWSQRRATKAAQKLPANYEDILKEAFLREAHTIRNHNIPAALRVNTDQTQIVYQQGTKTSWNESGVKQVAMVGHLPLSLRSLRVVYSFLCKQSLWGKLMLLVPTQKPLLTTTLFSLVWRCSRRKQVLTGQQRQQWRVWSTTSSRLILTRPRRSLAYRRSSVLSGRLIVGQFTNLTSSELG